jgi:hypothetical protein
MRRAAVLVLLAAACSPPGAGEKAALNRARIQAENSVLLQSRVPKSVVFRNEHAVMTKHGAIVCGEFSGRDAHGVMADYARFIFDGKDARIDDGRPDFEADWQDVCAPR